MNKAEEIIIPSKSGIFRTVFLYVGQGEATLMAVPEGEKYKYVLIDCNLEKGNEGIDLIKLLKDLLGKNKLDVFINTHPHDDHLNGIKEIYDEIGIKEVWHSGHKPGKEYEDAYKNMKYVIDKVGSTNVYQLLGSKEANKLDGSNHPLGDVTYNILAPAEHICDEIEKENADERYARIHEQCGVLRIEYGKEPARILITGDSDRKAWENHITTYHKDRIKSDILSASHHGSRTFFKEGKDDEPFKDHIKEIEPTYIIVSAPKQSESKHDHPHDDAIKLYKEYVSEENIFHLGSHKKKRVCVIVDIESDGELTVDINEDLIDTYKCNKDNEKKEDRTTVAPYVVTQIDRKQMGK